MPQGLVREPSSNAESINEPARNRCTSLIQNRGVYRDRSSENKYQNNNQDDGSDAYVHMSLLEIDSLCGMKGFTVERIFIPIISRIEELQFNSLR